jgi:hypothetical protein
MRALRPRAVCVRRRGDRVLQGGGAELVLLPRSRFSSAVAAGGAKLADPRVATHARSAPLPERRRGCGWRSRWSRCCRGGDGAASPACSSAGSTWPYWPCAGVRCRLGRRLPSPSRPDMPVLRRPDGAFVQPRRDRQGRACRGRSGGRGGACQRIAAPGRSVWQACPGRRGGSHRMVRLHRRCGDRRAARSPARARWIIRA